MQALVTVKRIDGVIDDSIAYDDFHSHSAGLVLNPDRTVSLAVQDLSRWIDLFGQKFDDCSGLCQKYAFESAVPLDASFLV